ncbi:DUF4334 domain-containing protein [Lysobacter korlensis]|uniref:DUF4334 domain-containing protein n=1 Tax=Lysobacter korlensis TaxID=553636 RepID=A0ABV6RJ26_9GAMM
MESPAATPHWLASARGRGTTLTDALAMFDALEPVTVDAMIGRWSGYGLKTGHVLDGMLEAFGWRGKQFVDAETVHPLLFADAQGKTIAIDPRRLPIRLATRLQVQRIPGVRRAFELAQPLLCTEQPAARLRLMHYRGGVTAAMLYDGVPIHDVFRRIDDERVLGLMDCRYFESPFFFVLERA